MASVPLVGLFSDSGRAAYQGQVLCGAHGRIDYRCVVISSGRGHWVCRFSIVLSTMTFAISTRCMIVTVMSRCAPLMLSLNS
ncbi:permease component [Pseudomonas syringae pv. actinidiae]|uniref:Permease component n=1 Tax=Pseudomonas syringae pv. actinidiae TaxID=103796 RepID=A0AAN4TQ57_PSESF|nr:permease component [Pseudomonas syringae pv. actinidiae]